MSKKLLVLCIIAIFLVRGGYNLYGAYCNPPAECANEPSYEPDCVPCDAWYLNPAYEIIANTDPYFEARNYLIIPYVAPVELLTAKGINPPAFDFDCYLFLRNINDLMETVEFGFRFLSPDLAYAASSYSCSFDVVNNKTVNFRLPMEEGCMVLTDDTQDHFLDVRRLTDGSEFPGLSIEGLGPISF